MQQSLVKLKPAERRGDGGFLPILGGNGDMVESVADVDDREDRASCKPRQMRDQLRDGIRMENRPFV